MKHFVFGSFFVFVLVGCGAPICPFGIGEKCLSKEDYTKNAPKLTLLADKTTTAINEIVKIKVQGGTGPYTFTRKSGTGTLQTAPTEATLQARIAETNVVSVTDSKNASEEITIITR